ncbi:unnamed protein product, partial [Onchocerca ochengi]
IIEADAVPSFDNIESALKGCFRTEFFEDLKLSTSGSETSSPNYPRKGDFIKKRFVNDASSINIVFLPTSTDQSVLRRRGKESNDTYPTSCRFCGGMLRAIDKYREDRKLTLQCRRRKCMKFNGLTANKQAKQVLSEMAKAKAPQTDYGWYLSDPVKHSYGIFANDSDSSDSELDRDMSTTYEDKTCVTPREKQMRT